MTITSLVELEGGHLGQKHKNYNILVNDHNRKNDLDFEKFDIDEPDIQNLIKIDVACNKRNIDYLLKVLVCEDFLYVSRAIKQSKWLITEKEYSHVVNPQYLHSTLFTKMSTKAANKLIKNIQIHLKDEKRVEQFYEYETNPMEAVKWLNHCSLEFIENNLAQHVNYLTLSDLKRLSKKSILFLAIYLNNCEPYMKANALQATAFLLHSETDEYLEFLKSCPHHSNVQLNARATKLIMKDHSNKIIDNIHQYGNFIHIPTFIKFLKGDKIEDFLINLFKKNSEMRYDFWTINCEQLILFLEAMPETQRFEFVKKVFIDKIFKDKSIPLHNTERMSLNHIYDLVYIPNEYFWYQYAPFEVAFNYITKILKPERNMKDKKKMLDVLLKSSRKNETYIYRILEFFDKKLRKASQNLRSYFINKITTLYKFLRFNKNTWQIIENIILQSELDDSDEAQLSLRVLIVYKVVHSLSIPISIEKKIKFNTFKVFKNKLNNQEKDLMFTYLYNIISQKIGKEISIKDDKINESIETLHLAFNLLIDWNRDLKDYPLLLNEVKRLKTVVNNSSCKSDMSVIYNMKKSWRKYMFEDSLYLNLNKYTLINAIKHDSTLLTRYQKEIQTPKFVKVPSTSQFLQKIKLYFATSLAVEFRRYFEHELENMTNHANATRGIFELYSRIQTLDILNKYAPLTGKINNTEIDSVILSIQRYFAKNMHKSRPHPPPEIILVYAKGDYVQYALPSLLSIFYNLNKIKSRIFIPDLLESQVSLQKHGIRLAFTKLQSHELIETFSSMWQTNKNSAIRSVIFKIVFELLRKENGSSRMNEIWNLLTTLIDNLNLQEEKNIFDLLFHIDKVPSKIRSKYFIKVYPFLKKLVNFDNENYCYSFYNIFLPEARKIIEEFPSAFVAKVLVEEIDDTFNKNNNLAMDYAVIQLTSSYLLCAKDDDTQIKKYNEVFTPFFKYTLSIWSKTENGKINQRIDLYRLLDQLFEDVPNFSIKNNFIIPTKMFKLIQNELEDFPIQESYVMLTKWKLAVAFIEAVQNRKSINWDESCLEIANSFGQICNIYLKEDCDNHFSYIYTLFVISLKSFFNKFVSTETMYEICKSMLHNIDLIEAYLVVIKIISKHNSDELSIKKITELRKSILEHPSLEVKIHYYRSLE